MTSYVSARSARWARSLAGIVILTFLGWQLGAAPFLDGLRSTTLVALAAGAVITAGTTWCCAVRWSLLAGRLQVAVAVPEAYRACYRAQFLNVTLPAGILGDVHRAIRHGRDAGALARALRSVFWDRVTGQVVQVALAAVAVLMLPGAVRNWVLGLLLVGVVVAGLGCAAVAGRRPGRALARELRAVPGAPGVWQRVAALSALAVGGHLLAFVVAARSVGVAAPLVELVPLGLVVLTASAVPLSIAGWGPREGGAAWIFGAVGLGTETGVAVAVVYGVMVLVATLPGALLLRRPATGTVVTDSDREVRHG